ncbi:MAG TPA: CocE/NonD family hydrolase [Thermoplasmata archaeon]|nr:CocE/NonD family hydrolase [Thermoplasmata archaeon]
MKKMLIILMIVLLVLPVNIVLSTNQNSLNNNQKNNTDTSVVDHPISFQRFKTTYMVPMRDGVHLATDLYCPILRSSPHGAILIRTPYSKDAFAIIGILGILRGWPVVIQDMRGRFASEGIDTGFKNDSTDGSDTLGWIVNQTWSNGKIITYGLSALGIVEYCLAGAHPANLTCQYIQVATPNLYKHATFQGGEFRKNLVEDWLNDQESDYLLEEIKENENFTLGYWGNVTLDDNWEDVNVPAIHIGGWYDIFSQGTIEGYLGYQHLAGPGAQGKSKLIMGPWTHTGFLSRTQGELTYPRNSLDRFSLQMFRDMVRLYVDNNNDTSSDWPTVSYYVMGDVDNRSAPGNEWRYADDWPIPADNVSWFFHSDGTLTTTAQGDSEPMTYLYDPINPVPTVGGKNLYSPAGPYDQSSVENRSDVLLFTSQFLTTPFEATGPIRARLFVSSDCPDTDFTVKLTDVYADGRSMFITDGILRMRNRNSQEHWELIEPGALYEITVDLWSTSYIWNVGHRIRVEVSSSNYPRFLNNPNTVDGIGKNTTYTVAQNTLFVDSTHPSCIILPEPDQYYQKMTLERPTLLTTRWFSSLFL